MATHEHPSMPTDLELAQRDIATLTRQLEEQTLRARLWQGDAEDQILDSLSTATERLADVKDEVDELIELAISKGISERRIGAAAGMSGPAIHQRKARKRMTTQTPTGGCDR